MFLLSFLPFLTPLSMFPHGVWPRGWIEGLSTVDPVRRRLAAGRSTRRSSGAITSPESTDYITSVEKWKSAETIVLWL